MEFGERKRRRKSRSFKLVTDEGSTSSFVANSCCKDASRESKSTALPDVWVRDEGMEIKRQITGMMRLLSDKGSRAYQRVGAEPDSLTREPQDRHVTWTQQPASQSVGLEEHQSNSWNPAGDLGCSSSTLSTPVCNGPGSNQYSTSSRTSTVLSKNTTDPVEETDTNAAAAPKAAPASPCCMCNCKGTLQAILREMRAMRRLMQITKEDQAASLCQLRPLGPDPRCRRRRRRLIYKVAPLTVSSTRRPALTHPEAPELTAVAGESGQRRECEKEQESAAPSRDQVSCRVSVPPPPSHPAPDNNTSYLNSTPQMEPQVHESEVRLAENYDVFISKAQLDSILVNYTRSGSLLFRKLVCAFFDDATLANSLPNGKRKRGLNDNRKGLDQNIVGAIKVFTEKYCTEHKIEKLPGPRDWVQILQDQIKLARRRLKRDATEAEMLNVPPTGHDCSKLVTGGVTNLTDRDKALLP